MKAIKAIRAKIKVNDVWESPALHILLTREDNVIVARCLDLTVASHGNDEREAINAITGAAKEYWRIFNELEARQVNMQLKRSLKKSVSVILQNKSTQPTIEISHA